jgi:hypothetical protein
MTKRIGFAPENGSFSDLFKPASLMTNPIDSSDKNKIQVLINDILEDLNDNSRQNEDIYTLIATTPYQRAAKVNDPKVKERLQNSLQVATENMNKAGEKYEK